MPGSLKPYFFSLAIYFLTACLPASSQRKTVRGVVKDSHSEERIPFASVSFKNSTIGKLTDSSGSFSFNLDAWPSDTLVITCVGYQPFLLVINKARDSVLAEIMMERGTFNDGVSVRVKVNKGLL